MPVDPGALRSRLGELGQPLGEYSQAAAIARVARGATPIGGGACTGTCVDWLRRVLRNEGKRTYAPDESKTRRVLAAQDALERTIPELERKRHTATVGQQRATVDERKAKLRSELERVRARRTERQRQYDSDWAAFERCMDPGQRRALLARAQTHEPELALLEAAEKRLAAAYNGAPDDAQRVLDDIVKQRSDKSPVHRMWDDFKSIMQTNGGKSYADMSVVLSVPTGAFQSPLHLVVQLLKSPDMSNGRGALIDVSPGARGGAGHTIAIYRQRNGDILLFDPNFGTWQFNPATQCALAFNALFTQGYDNCLEANGGVKASYTIFGGTEAEPTVQSAALYASASAAAAAATSPPAPATLRSPGGPSSPAR